MKRKQYFMQAPGTETWVSIHKSAIGVLRKAGWTVTLDERGDIIYVEVERE